MDWEEMEREALMEDRRKGREPAPAGNNARGNSGRGNTGRGKRPTRTNARGAPPRKRTRGRR